MSLGPARRFAAWQRHERMAAAIDRIGSNLLILDIGCGPGQIARMIGQRQRVVGLDIALAPLETAARWCLAVCADATSLPFDDASFDVVICSQTLYHLPLHQALREFARVLRPEGTLVLEQGMLADVSLWPTLAYWAVRKRAPGRLRLEYPSGRTSWRRLSKALRDTGFEVRERVGLEISTGPLYRRRIAKRLAQVVDAFPQLASQQIVLADRR